MKKAIRKPPKKRTCPHCGKTFAAPQGLAGHLRYLHPDKAPLGTQGKQALRPAKSTPASPPVGAPKAGVRTPLKTKKLTCPHCDQTFTTAHRLSTHIQYRHRDKTSAATAPPQTTSPKVTAPEVAASNASAQEHLKTALQELTERQSDIEEQLSRMETLHSEKEAIAKQIEAVNTAMQAFK